MKTLRTPDERFDNLPGYSFTPHYVEVDDSEGSTLRVHYVDEGTGPVVLLMHGEPSWSYLYRKMIPALVDAGFRCIAPDLVGFGRSDKPTERSDYTYERHVEWMRATLFDQLDLNDITFFGQDWGGLIGLRLVGEHPDPFARVVVGNTYLPTGDTPAGKAFLNWQKFSQEVPTFPTGMIINGGCTSDLSEATIAAYDAPYPDEDYKSGARQFPLLVPTTPDDPASAANRGAWDVLRKFERPFLTAFSDSDPITAGGFSTFQRDVPGCEGQPHATIKGGGHFLQEDRGEDLARVIVDWIGRG